MSELYVDRTKVAPTLSKGEVQNILARLAVLENSGSVEANEARRTSLRDIIVTSPDSAYEEEDA